MKHTEATKLKLSIIRKNWLKNKTNHNWSRYKNKESVPEKLFKQIISTVPNIEIYQYYIPPENDRFFELDFAIPNKKIAFEINGNQHYNKDGNLTEYFQNRHNYFKSLGWMLIEIPYTYCFNENKIKDIIHVTLNTNFSTNIYEIINHKIQRKQKNKKIYGTHKDYYKQRHIILQEKNKDLIKKIQESNIDFFKFGWVIKISKLINKKPQHINKFMKLYMPIFYQTCYKRKKRCSNRGSLLNF